MLLKAERRLASAMETLAQSIQQATDERAATSPAVSRLALEAIQSFTQASEALKQVEILLSRRGNRYADAVSWRDIAEWLGDIVSYQRLWQRYKELAGTTDVRALVRKLGRQSDAMRIRAQQLYSAATSTVSSHSESRPLATSLERHSLFENGRLLASAVGALSEAVRHSGNGRPADYHWEQMQVLIATGVLDKVAAKWRRLGVLIARHGPREMPWGEIGACLGGMSKQLAQYHYGPHSDSVDIAPFLSELSSEIAAAQEMKRRLDWAVATRRGPREAMPRRRLLPRSKWWAVEEAVEEAEEAIIRYLRANRATPVAERRKTVQLIAAWFHEGRPLLNEWLRGKPPHVVSLTLHWAATRPDLFKPSHLAQSQPPDPNGPAPTRT